MLFSQRFSKRAADPPAEWSQGGVERRIVAEVVAQLRISPRFSDDGRPEGTCERPLSIHVDEPARAEPVHEVEDEQDIDVVDALIRPYRD